MRTAELRLNDILTNTPIVSFDTDNAEIDKFLYDSVVGSYKYSYINADNKEQFYDLFTEYWNRNIKITRQILLNQIALGENLWNARKETREGNSNQTDTPNYTDNEKWGFGRVDTFEHGKVLEITPDITETDNSSSNGSSNNTGTDTTNTTDGKTQYDRQIVIGTQETTRTPNLTNTSEATANNTHKRNGTETHTNTGKDSNTQSGENTRTLTRTGEKTVEFSDSSTNAVVVYDSEKLLEYLRMENSVNVFIDIFSPLFNDILMYSNTLFGRII